MIKKLFDRNPTSQVSNFESKTPNQSSKSVINSSKEPESGRDLKLHDPIINTPSNSSEWQPLKKGPLTPIRVGLHKVKQGLTWPFRKIGGLFHHAHHHVKKVAENIDVNKIVNLAQQTGALPGGGGANPLGALGALAGGANGGGNPLVGMALNALTKGAGGQ